MTDLEQVYDDHAQALFGFVWNWTHSEAETFDVLQEVFMRLAKRSDVFDSVDNQRAYLIQMARRCLLDARRKQARRRAREASVETERGLFASDPDPDAAVFNKALDQALAQLPDEQRTIVYLKLWQNCTFREIADSLEISSNTAASRYRLGLQKLQHALQPLYQEICP